VPIKAEEYVDDIDQVIKGRVVTVDFELMNVTAALAVRATNRPTPTTTGSGTTLRTTVKLPQLGAEQYQMIGWQSTDDTERIVAANAFQIGTLEVGRHKGSDVATFKLQFKLFPDSNGDPIQWDFAGTARGLADSRQSHRWEGHRPQGWRQAGGATWAIDTRGPGRGRGCGARREGDPARRRVPDRR
jgi:hypothetical protein